MFVASNNCGILVGIWVLLDKAKQEEQVNVVFFCFFLTSTKSCRSSLMNKEEMGERKVRGCSSVGRASDRHAVDAGSMTRCGKGFFSQSQLSVQTVLRCPDIPVCNRKH